MNIKISIFFKKSIRLFFSRIQKRVISELKKRVNIDSLIVKIKLVKIKLKYKNNVIFRIKNVIPDDIKMDIVIPAIEKDLEVLPYVIDSARRYIKHQINEIMEKE